MTAAVVRQPVRVLLVEDNPGDARLIRELLKPTRIFAFKLDVADRLEAAIHHLERTAVDVVLLDLGLPDSQGLDTFRRMQERLEQEPVVVISGDDDERMALEAVRSGAQDYLVKGRIGSELLTRVIQYAMERKRTGRALREREQRFSQLAENIQEVFFIVGVGLREMVYVSPAYREIWGLDPATLYDDPASMIEAVAAEDRGVLTEAFEQARRGETTSEVEFRVVRPVGDTRWVRAQLVAVRDERAEVYRICGTARDVTNRKLAEEALRTNERRARTLFETVNLIVLGLDPAGRIEYVNPFLLQLTGYTREELLGRDWFDLIPEAPKPAVRDVFREMLQGDLHAHYENPILTKAGQERMVAWNNTVLRDPRGRPTGSLSIGEDITDRLNLEQQLRQAHKMEAIGRLAGGIAHDFNNVLTAIFGYLGLLAEELAPGSPAAQDVDDIGAAAERAAGLTRQLLAFSRQQIMEPIVLHPNDLIGEVDKMLRRVLGEDVVLRLQLDPAAGNVRADPGQLQQVLLNLVVNARDAMPAGGSLVIETANADLGADYMRSHPVVVPGSYVLISVTDSGTGMDARTQARIFEPFFTTKGPGKGTGLGLSTAYGIVKQSGGYIWVYSEPGRGTTFKIYLPRRDAPAESVSAAPEAERLTGTETILLAEDEPMLRPLAKSVLERMGYTVLAAEGAVEALAIGQRYTGPIHLLVSDVVMPGPSGPELGRRLLEARPDTKVLYMSGYTDEAIAQHGMLEPGLNFLQKPFTPVELARKVREVLDRS